MQEDGETLFLQSFPADTDLAEVLNEIKELRRCVRQSKILVDNLCKEHKLLLHDSSKTFKPSGRLHPDQVFIIELCLLSRN